MANGYNKIEFQKYPPTVLVFIHIYMIIPIRLHLQTTQGNVENHRPRSGITVTNGMHAYSNSGANATASPADFYNPPEGETSHSKGKKKASSEAIAVGHREGKCLTTAGWELIVGWLKERTGHEWSQPALLKHWKAMRKDHTQLFELLNCSGITYDHNLNAIVAPDHWWETKIRIRLSCKMFRTMNCKEMYDDYTRLFGDTYNSDKFALTPTKMGRNGGFLSSGYGKAGPSNDTISVSAEMSDESDGGDVNKKGSAMDFS